MPATVLRENGEIVRALSEAVHIGDSGLKTFPPLIKRVIREDRWQAREVDVLGRVVEFRRFIDFIAEHPPEGLGADLPLIKRMCGGDSEALDLIDRATQGKRGHPAKDNVDNINNRPTGTSADQALRKLRKDRPELHQRVIAGELSPHAAMVEAGFRHKTATVPVDDPDKVAEFLAKHFEPVEIREIADLAVFLVEGRG